MAKSVSLRKPAPELPPPAPAAEEPMLLLKPGQIIRKTADGKVEEVTSQQLASAMSPAVAEAAQASQQAFEQDVRALASRPVAKPQREITWDQLTPAQREEYAASMAAAAAAAKLHAIAGDPAPADAPPAPPAAPPAPPAAPPAPPAARPVPAAPAPPAAPAAPAPPAAGSTLGGPQLCPHCHRDVAATPTPEPTDFDKESFRLAFLGCQAFTRVHRVLGSAEITFRALTIEELDEIFKYLSHLEKAGKISGPMERMELFQRFRLYLQLLVFRTPTFNHEMPDGLTKATNPHAESHWEFEPDASLVERFDAIRAYMHENVLRTENVFRVLMRELTKFNQLVAKMEDMLSGPDF